jgi:serralysin
LAAVASVTPGSDPYTNALLGNYRWASGTLSYSFPTAAGVYGSPYGSSEQLNNFGVLNWMQQNAARAAFANFAAVANVTFTELAGTDASATLRLAMSNEPSTAWAYLPATPGEGGDVWFNNSGGYYNNPVRGNYAYATFLHEIGHAMGLEHPHENGMPLERDTMEFTVMSYRSYVGASTSTGYVNENWGFAQTLMMQDIAAIQLMYGANFNFNSGSTTYSWDPNTGQMFTNGAGQAMPGGNRIFQTVWDGGGVDTYDFSNYGTNLYIDLRPGQWNTVSDTQLAKLHYNGSQKPGGNIANALQYNGDARSLIENAVGGSGIDTLIGNDANNVLIGGGGNDTMIGGLGDDVYEVTEAGDTVMELANEGYDWVSTSTNYTLGANLEGLYLYGAVNGTGNELSNRLVGSAQSNVLIGGGGNDTIIGGLGDDVFQFHKGEVGTDSIIDFSHVEGDLLRFVGYSADAVLQQVDASNWKVIDGEWVNAIHFANGATIGAGDYFFI